MQADPTMARSRAVWTQADIEMVFRAIFLGASLWSVFASFPSLLLAQNIQELSERLEIIADFADRICGAPNLEGKGEDIELTGTAKAGIDGLISRLVDAGVEGAAKYKSQSFNNVLQTDLKDVLLSGGACRERVIEKYESRLFSDSSENGSNPSALNSNMMSKLQLFNRSCGEYKVLYTYMATKYVTNFNCSDSACSYFGASETRLCPDKEASNWELCQDPLTHQFTMSFVAGDVKAEAIRRTGRSIEFSIDLTCKVGSCIRDFQGNRFSALSIGMSSGDCAYYIVSVFEDE